MDETTDLNSIEPEDSERGDNGQPRRVYTPPRLSQLMSIAELLEVLGPAQANYGGSGMP